MWMLANSSQLLFFRGASTGERNRTDPELREYYPDLLDVQVGAGVAFWCCILVLHSGCFPVMVLHCVRPLCAGAKRVLRRPARRQLGGGCSIFRSSGGVAFFLAALRRS